MRSRDLQNSVLASTAFLMVSAANISAGAPFTSAVARAQSNLENAISRLGALRQSVERERIPLAVQVRALEAELVELRKEVLSIRQADDLTTLSRTAKERAVAMRREENRFIAGLLDEYAHQWESELPVAKIPVYDAALHTYHLRMDAADRDPAEAFSARFDQIGLAFQRLQQALGGHRFSGQALTPDGHYETGTFVQVGPLCYFSSAASESVGMVEATRELNPRVRAIPTEHSGDVRTFCESGDGPLPLDPTLGHALAMEKTKESLSTHIAKGGLWIFPILGFALAATLCAVFKLIELYRIQRPPIWQLHTILELLKDDRQPEALTQAQALQGPVGLMLSAAVEHAGESKELIEETLYECMLDTQPRLERFLPFIAITAAISPLLGLLGTVTGMIKTFKLITVFGAGDAKMLSAGISEALVTTEFGLIVAIPALVLHALLSRKAQSILAYMEKVGTAFINGLAQVNGRSPSCG